MAATPSNPLYLPLRFVPDRVHSALLARAINHALRGQAVVEQFGPLHGKVLRIDVYDIPCRFHLRFEHKRVHADPGHRHHVCFRGRLADFLALVGRREDPDTLFFSRRLGLEGETETGLYIKNLLYALEYDWQAHLNHVFGPVLAPHVARALARLPARWLHTLGVGR